MNSRLLRPPACLWRLLWRCRAAMSGGLLVGDMFPDFALQDLAGRVHSLSDPFPGDGTVLWFTNLCEDCRSKAPMLEAARGKAGGRMRVMAVSLLGADRTWPERLQPGCGFPFLLDPEDITAGRLGLPHPPGACPLHNLFILDRRGRVAARHHLSALDETGFAALWGRAA